MSGLLKHIDIAFTGVLSKVRREMEQEASSLGATVSTNVKPWTDWLVVGKRPGAKKRADAEEHGVHVMSEETFRAEIAARAGPDAGSVAKDDGYQQSETRRVVNTSWVQGVAVGEAVRF